MTSKIHTFALATLLAVASLTPAMHAQEIIRATVTVPFSFDYGTTHFGRGTYVITMNGQNTLLVRNRATSQAAWAMVQMQFNPTAQKASLVTFKKYGDRYFLEDVSIAGSGTSVSVYESKPERQAAQELAQRGTEATQVALALLPVNPFGN